MGLWAIHASDWLIGAFAEEDRDRLRREVGHHLANTDDMCKDSHINVLEMWAVMDACKRWSSLWRDSNLVVVTDNMTVRAALNTGNLLISK